MWLVCLHTAGPRPPMLLPSFLVCAENGPYELVLVSPRNHMVYTPLLPSEPCKGRRWPALPRPAPPRPARAAACRRPPACTRPCMANLRPTVPARPAGAVGGVVSENSIVESIRNILGDKVGGLLRTHTQGLLGAHASTNAAPRQPLQRRAGPRSRRASQRSAAVCPCPPALCDAPPA